MYIKSVAFLFQFFCSNFCSTFFPSPKEEEEEEEDFVVVVVVVVIIIIQKTERRQ